MLKLWAPGALFIAAMTCVGADPAAAQAPTLAQQAQTDSEKQLAQLATQAQTALANARAAAQACNAQGLRSAITELQQLRRQANQAAAAAKAAGSFSAIRQPFATSVQNEIEAALRDASALKLNCPKPPEKPAQTTPPPPPQPPVRINGGYLLPKIHIGPPNPVDDLDDEADDAVDDYWDAFDHCDRAGMKDALAHLRDIAERAHAMHKMAERAGKFSKLSKDDIEELIGLEEDIDDFIDDARFDVPLCPRWQLIPRTGIGCPLPLPKIPREPILVEPLHLKFGYIPRLTYSRYSFAMLDYQNQLRTEFGSPPLQWNPVLAEHALGYAKTMAETGQLVHSPRNTRPPNERENLSISLHGANSLQTMLDGWGSEYRYLKPGIFPDISTTGDWTKVGHISQIVWPTTTQVGCGFYAGMKYDALVCRYSPPGNRDGTPLVSPRQSDCMNREDYERGE